MRILSLIFNLWIGQSIVRLHNKGLVESGLAGLRKPGSKMALWCDGLLTEVEERVMVASEFKVMIWVRKVSWLKLGDPKGSSRLHADREEKVQKIATNLKEIHLLPYIHQCKYVHVLGLR